MKELVTILVAATLGSISFQVSPVAAENSRKLSGSQIRERFTGKHQTDEVHFLEGYDRDRRLRNYSNGRKTVLYFKEPDDGCYEVSLSGDRIEMKPSGLGLSIEGILQAPTDRN